VGSTDAWDAWLYLPSLRQRCGGARGSAFPRSGEGTPEAADTLGRASLRPSVRRSAARREEAAVRGSLRGKRALRSWRGSGTPSRSAARNRRRGQSRRRASAERDCRPRPLDGSRNRRACRGWWLRASARSSGRRARGGRRRSSRACSRRDSNSGSWRRREVGERLRRGDPATAELRRGAPGGRRA
jgi:hypothetical protein